MWFHRKTWRELDGQETTNRSAVASNLLFVVVAAWRYLKSKRYTVPHGDGRWCKAALPHCWSRTRSNSPAWLHSNVTDVETHHPSACAKVYGDRARPAGDRRLRYPLDWFGHEECGDSYPCPVAIAWHQESSSCRARHWIDGCVRLCRTVPHGNREASIDGRFPSRCSRLGADLRRPERVALPFSWPHA